MTERREASARSQGAANGVTPPGPGTDRERVLLLECRLEQMRSALDAAREEADRARSKLAEAAAREAEHARSYSLIHQELAEARAEIGFLHRHLERSEALRAEIAGHLFETGDRGDSEELLRLRQKVLADDQRALVSDRTVARLRERVEELTSSRETLLVRIAEWQQLIREDGPEAADLSEFLAELRRDILELEHRNVTGEAREAELRERLAMAGIDPDQPAEPVAAWAPEAPWAPDPDPEAEAERPRDTAEDPEPAATSNDGAPAWDGTHASDEPPATQPPAVPPPPEPPVVPPPREVRGASDQPEASDAPAGPEAPGASGESETSNAPAGPEAPGASGESEVPGASEPWTAPASARPESARSRTDMLMAELLDADATATQADLLLRLGRSGKASAVAAVRPWTASPEPSVRAAAYEALGRLLERAPSALEPYLRTGLADADARVRRRVVLAAATARGVSRGELLDPLREDPDPQVRRVVREVLRQAPPDDPAPHAPPGGGRRRHAEALPPTAPEDRPPAAASRATRDPSAPKRSRRR